jgi:hypothetical protein
MVIFAEYAEKKVKKKTNKKKCSLFIFSPFLSLYFYIIYNDFLSGRLQIEKPLTGLFFGK